MWHEATRTWNRKNCFFFILFWVGFLISLTVARKWDVPELSSTHLQMHKIYMTSPSHDSALYNILHVAPNATAAQITKQYRILSRKYHPDKIGSDNKSVQLKQVQDAYDILKDDSTRLPYHQYGLTDPNVAVAILLGPHHHRSSHLVDEAHFGLLQLMGYENFGHYEASSASLDARGRRQERIRFVAARLVELLRPIVEGSVSPAFAAHYLASQCDMWKRLPLGAQVIRCVGRAYRHAGQDYLQHKKNVKKGGLDYYSVPVRQQWRKAKAFWTAFLATGKATVTERALVQQEKRRKQIKEKQRDKEDSATHAIDSYAENLGHIGDWESDDDDFIFSDDDSAGEDDEEERKYIEQFRAKQTLLTSLQVEALWKVAKIDLETVIRRACRLILSQQYFFFPSHQTMDSGGIPPHGWVTSQGTIIDVDDALHRTAEALIFLGNVMVERSKIQTSWKD